MYYVLALVIFIVPIYVRIYLVARRQARLIARQVAHLDRNSRSRDGKENVAAKTIGNVLTAFIICWLPLIVMPIVFRFIDDGPKVRKILKWVQTIALCSSALNPVIYSLKTQMFKKDLRKIGRAIFRRRAWEEKPEIVWRNLSKKTCHFKKPRHFFPYNWKQHWWVDDALDNLIFPLPQFSVKFYPVESLFPKRKVCKFCHKQLSNFNYRRFWRIIAGKWPTTRSDDHMIRLEFTKRHFSLVKSSWRVTHFKS